MAHTILNFPIETKEAQKFWASSHISNQTKAIIAFSLNEKNAMDNLRRYGYKLQWRKRAWGWWGQYVNNPAMSGVPFSTQPWWKETAEPPVPPDTSPIDFLSETLDPRVRFTCASPHIFVDKDRFLEVAKPNVYPLEYKEGVAIGRHEPELSAFSYQPSYRVMDIGAAGSGSAFILAGGQKGQAIGPDDIACGSVKATDWSKYGIYNEGTKEWIVPETTHPVLDDTWRRFVVKYKVEVEGPVRTYLIRKTSANYLYGLTNKPVPVGDTVSSVFIRQYSDAVAMCFAQVESGTIATSPVTESNLFRSEMTVSVSTEKAKGAKIKFTDGTETEITFTSGQSRFEIPKSQNDWGTRYITGIEYVV